MEPVTQSPTPNGNPFPEPKTISPENGSVLETQDKDVIMEGLGSVGIYDQWIAPSISGQCPNPRYAVLHSLSDLPLIYRLEFFFYC